jgi:G-protein alpha subunit
VESCDIFSAFVNNRIFAQVAFILFLNKTDLLEQKHKHCHISDFFLDFSGDPENLTDVQTYILSLFTARVDGNIQRKTVYHHWTTVIDTQHTQRIFSDVKEEIRRENIRKLGLM